MRAAAVLAALAMALVGCSTPAASDADPPGASTTPATASSETAASTASASAAPTALDDFGVERCPMEVLGPADQSVNQTPEVGWGGPDVLGGVEVLCTVTWSDPTTGLNGDRPTLAVVPAGEATLTALRAEVEALGWDVLEGDLLQAVSSDGSKSLFTRPVVLQPGVDLVSLLGVPAESVIMVGSRTTL